MARPGKEKVFFLASLGLTGLLGTLLLTEELRLPTVPAGKAPPSDALAFADVGRAPRGALRGTSWASDGREAFREPRDWLPMPPVDLERPPLREPSYVPPPLSPAAALSRFGLYRQPPQLTPHNFAADAAPSVDGADDAASGATASGAAAPAASSAPAPAAAPPGSVDEELQKRFDWLELATDPRPWYVVIKNEDKFRLLERPTEKIEFTRIDPRTNRVMIGGTLERERLKPDGIHFAATPFNRAELALRAIPEAQWGAATLPRLLDAAALALSLGSEDPACWQSAVARLEKWLAIDPRASRTYELLADTRAALLDFEGELLVLQRARTAGLESAGLAVRHARWLQRAGARSGALARLADAVQRFPVEREARLAYGRALLEEGSPESVALAITQFGQAEQGSTSAEQRMEVIAEGGAALLERGDAARALEEAKRILKIDAQAPLGFRLEGAADFALGNFSDAEGDYERLLAAARTPRAEAEALLGLGIVRTRLRQFDQARADLRRVGQVDPLLAAAATAAEAELLATTGNLDDGLGRARDAVARAPDDAYLRYFLGRLLRKVGDVAAARTELRRSLELGAGFPDLFDELGYLALLQGAGADARRYFEESLAREERDESRLRLAHAHLVAGDLGRARTLFDALQAKRATSEALLGMAYCAYRSGESAVAQQLWVQVKEELKGAPEEDVAYATRWLAAVLDLESKQGWEDSLQWSEVGNGWSDQMRFGPELKSTPPGNVRISGVQKPGNDIANWSYLARDVELSLFHELEVECQFAPSHQGRMGMGLVHYMAGASGQAPRLRAALTIALDVDGSVLLQRCEHVGNEAFEKIGTHAVKAGETVRLTLRRAERGNEKFQFFLNGAPLSAVVEMAPWKGRTRQQISALFFGAAAGGKTCDVRLERVRRIEFLAQ